MVLFCVVLYYLTFVWAVSMTTRAHVSCTLYYVSAFFGATRHNRARTTAQDFQGAAECALAQIVGSRNQTWEGVLSGGLKSTTNNAPSKVIVRAEEVASSNALVELTLGPCYIRQELRFHALTCYALTVDLYEWASQSIKNSVVARFGQITNVHLVAVCCFCTLPVMTLPTVPLRGRSNAPNCFLRFSRTGETGPPMPCFKTEVAKVRRLLYGCGCRTNAPKGM